MSQSGFSNLYASALWSAGHCHYYCKPIDALSIMEIMVLHLHYRYLHTCKINLPEQRTNKRNLNVHDIVLIN